MNITDKSKFYKKLTALIEGGGAKKPQKKEVETTRHEASALRKIARKIIPKRIRKVLLKIKKTNNTKR